MEEIEKCAQCFTEIVEDTAELAPILYKEYKFCSDYCKNVFIQRNKHNEENGQYWLFS